VGPGGGGDTQFAGSGGDFDALVFAPVFEPGGKGAELRIAAAVRFLAHGESEALSDFSQVK
jgi:hypothetical protein